MDDVMDDVIDDVIADVIEDVACELLDELLDERCTADEEEDEDEMYGMTGITWQRVTLSTPHIAPQWCCPHSTACLAPCSTASSCRC